MCLTRSSFPVPSEPDEEETPAATLTPVLVIDQSLSELATAPEMAPDTSEQSSSGAVHITDFETVAFCKKSLTPAEH